MKNILKFLYHANELLPTFKPFIYLDNGKGYLTLKDTPERSHWGESNNTPNYTCINNNNDITDTPSKSAGN